MSTKPKVPNTALVSRRIRTLKGNIVTRLVKPDNPNIVDTDDVAAPQVARVNRRRTPAAPVADTAVAVAVQPVKEYDWTVHSHSGCCGGRILVAHEKPEGGEETLEAKTQRLTKEWETSPLGKAMCDRQTENLAVWEEGLQYLKINKRNLDIHYGYRQIDFNANIQYCKSYLVAYSLEQALKQGYVTGSNIKTFSDPQKALQGVTVSETEFSEALKTPAGLFVRCDYPIGNTNNFRDFAKAVPEVLKKVDSGYGYGPTAYDKIGSTSISGKVQSHIVLASMAREHQGPRNWAAVQQAVKIGAATPGTVFTCILNHNQNNAANDKSLAEWGFQGILITGNRNHGTGSVLYLYEHRLTQAEFDYIKTGGKNA